MDVPRSGRRQREEGEEAQPSAFDEPETAQRLSESISDCSSESHPDKDRNFKGTLCSEEATASLRGIRVLSGCCVGLNYRKDKEKRKEKKKEKKALLHDLVSRGSSLNNLLSSFR